MSRRVTIPNGSTLRTIESMEHDPEGWEVLVRTSHERWFSLGFLLRSTSLGIVGVSLRDAPSGMVVVAQPCDPSERRSHIT